MLGFVGRLVTGGVKKLIGAGGNEAAKAAASAAAAAASAAAAAAGKAGGQAAGQSFWKTTPVWVWVVVGLVGFTALLSLFTAFTRPRG